MFGSVFLDAEADFFGVFAVVDAQAAAADEAAGLEEEGVAGQELVDEAVVSLEVVRAQGGDPFLGGGGVGELFAGGLGA